MWHVDLFSYYHQYLFIEGWAFHPEYEVLSLAIEFPNGPWKFLRDWRCNNTSPGASARGPRATSGGYSVVLSQPDGEKVTGARMIFSLSNGTYATVVEPWTGALGSDPYHALNTRFFDKLVPSGANVLEIGSRNRSGNVRRELFPPDVSYTGFDITSGENVDVVGDAHELSRYFDADHFDVVLAMSTFEHLAMPWKAAIEINKVMKPGGILMITSHQTWPLHEQPWDFWRFSDQGWRCLFNQATGFEVLETAMGEQASIVPRLAHPIVIGHPLADTRLASAVVARKLGTAKVEWGASLEEVLSTAYPP